jgi:hypothetical protein
MNRQKMAKGERHEGPKMLHHVEVSEGDNGGYSVKHHFKSGAGGAYNEPEEHNFGPDEGPQMMEHVGHAMNIKSPEPSKAEGEETGENEEA